jgi:hypothetical protein
MSDQHLRISDAEREQAAEALAEHYVQGRLTTEEHSERLDQIWAARTRAEVAPVFRDLPGRFAPPPFPQPPRQPFPPAFRGYAAPMPPRRSKGMPAPLMAILVILVIATVLSHLPLILFGLLVWWILAKHHRVGSHHRAGSRRRW